MTMLLATSANEVGAVIDVPDYRNIGFLPVQISFLNSSDHTVTLEGRVNPDMPFFTIGTYASSGGDQLIEVTRLRQLRATTTLGTTGDVKVAAQDR